MHIDKGVPVFERLRVSPSCPLILPSHIALDKSREAARGVNAIGTTGRGIGPAYEDKVARRALRIADLFKREKFDEQLAMAEKIKPIVADVTHALNLLREQGANVLFEGAQGALLDVDHGTYPFVTSSNTTAGFAA